MVDPNGMDRLSRTYAWGKGIAGSVGGLLSITTFGDDGVTPTATYIPIYDDRGNVVGLSDATDGHLVATYQYDPFGKLIGESGDRAVLDANPFGFQTMFTDRETGLVWFQPGGYYSPALQRRLSREPAGEGESANLYVMFHNDPINRVDPDGSDDVQTSGAIDQFDLATVLDAYHEANKFGGSAAGRAVFRMRDLAIAEREARDARTDPFDRFRPRPAMMMYQFMIAHPEHWADWKKYPWAIAEFNAGRRHHPLPTTADIEKRRFNEIVAYQGYLQSIDETYQDPKWVVRTSGAFRGIADGIAFVLTSPLLLTPGAAAPAMAGDHFIADVRAVWTGEYTRTGVSTGVAKIYEAAGMDPKDAYTVGEIHDGLFYSAAQIDGFGSMARMRAASSSTIEVVNSVGKPGRGIVSPRQKLLDEVIERDFSGVQFTKAPVYDPALPAAGQAGRDGVTKAPLFTKIGPRAFSSTTELRVTLLEEELHHRYWGRGWVSDHPDVDEPFTRVIKRFFDRNGWEGANDVQVGGQK